MEKKTFIKMLDKQTNQLFNEPNLWGLVYDYLEICYKCKKLINDKRRYLINDNRICYNCLTFGGVAS